MQLKDEETKLKVIELDAEGYSLRQIEEITGIPDSTVGDFLRGDSWASWWKYRGLPKAMSVVPDNNKVKVLFCDIETSSMLLGGWALFNQNFSLEQIERDWELISFSAKWLGSEDIIYEDVSEQTEEEVLEKLHALLNG